MTDSLDEIVRVGGLSLAAVTRRSTVKHNVSGCHAFQCAKRPVAILVRDTTTTQAFLPDGSALSLAALECLHPGLLDAFERRCASVN